MPLVPRGAGTGYTGGAVPMHGGVVISLERMNRILEIDEANLLAVVEPNVITGDLQDAVERVGLFYPPDPASLRQSVIGGNVAECAGGPRAFKYGTTKQYVLGLEAVLPTGEVIETGGKVVKNVVGYDLTHLLVGSEGTLAIITQDHPAAGAEAAGAGDAARDVPERRRRGGGGVSNVIRARVVPAALELIDGDSLEAVAQNLERPLARAGGHRRAAAARSRRHRRRRSRRKPTASRRPAATPARPRSCARATRPSAQELWRVRRELSLSLKMITPLKFNHDVVVPKGRIPELFALVERIRDAYRLRIPCFGHAGDGNIHVNIMVTPGRRRRDRARARGREGAVRGRRRARRIDQRRARHRLREGAVPADRAVARRDRADEAGQAGVRSAQSPEPRQDLSRHDVDSAC